ncbi:hypothetical protein SteCoe_6291 [Stentor coeruleus]|uniref:Cilia- and flagella-associated protein 157 n=1 Tax=Stentor coeruleus TaxID=5963 RepID=A0A1R2CQH5_9CILI|nr:hypothetical protein SteCoe_6291 [Stentor coeruleus]
MSSKKSVKYSDLINDSFSSLFSLKENQMPMYSEGKSKAYIAAMRALQEKLVSIEAENKELKDEIKLNQQRIYVEKQEFEMKFVEERQHLEIEVKALKSRINELEISEKNLQKKMIMAQELIRLTETKTKYQEDLATRASEQFSLDKESFKLETELLKKANQESKQKESYLKKELEKEKRDIKLLREELHQQKKLNEYLQEEINFLRENNDMQRVKIEENYKSIRSDLIQQNQENLQAIKNLNIKNKSLQQMVNDTKKQGEYYKGQYIKMSHRSKFSLDLKKSRSKAKIHDSQCKSSVRSSTPSLRYSEHSYNPSIGNLLEEKELGQAIIKTELEVQKLGEKCHNYQMHKV